MKNEQPPGVFGLIQAVLLGDAHPVLVWLIILQLTATGSRLTRREKFHCFKLFHCLCLRWY